MFLNLFLQSIVQKLILWATYFMKNVLKVCRNAFILDCFPYRGNVLPEKRSWWQILDFVFTTECLCPIAACSGTYLSNFMFQFKFCTAYVICLQMLWKMRFWKKKRYSKCHFYLIIFQNRKENPFIKLLINLEKTIICLLLVVKFVFPLCSRKNKII